MISCILALVVGALVVVADQITKNYIVANFVEGQTNFDLGIDKIFNITYSRNAGGAWGMFDNRPWIVLALSSIIAVICVMMLIKYKSESKSLFWSITLVLSGGLGNLIDRIFRPGGKVVDFIDLEFMNFPIFNIADCAVCIGAGLLVLYFIIDMVKTSKNQKTVNKFEENK